MDEKKKEQRLITINDVMQSIRDYTARECEEAKLTIRETMLVIGCVGAQLCEELFEQMKAVDLVENLEEARAIFLKCFDDYLFYSKEETNEQESDI